MPHHGGANAKAHRTKCAVGAGVAVTTDNGFAGLCGADLRSDHVHDTAMFAAEAVQFYVEFFAILYHLPNLIGWFRVGNGIQTLFQSNQVTITPLRIDRTDAATLAAMQSWTF